MYKKIVIFIFSFFILNINSNCQVESITDVTVDNKTPEQIYNFLLSLSQEKYLQWHPEHREFKVLKSTPEILQSVFYFNDMINGSLVENEWEVVDLVKNKKIIMKSSQYGVALIIEINLVEDGTNTKVKHHLKIGKSMTNWVVKLFFTEKLIKDLHRHVEEEYKNLEWLIN